MTRDDTLFSLRYAVRVLERHQRMWRRIDSMVRLMAILSGTSAFAALMSQHQGAALATGLLFALLQAVEFALRPAERAADSGAARRTYDSVLARQSEFSDAALADAYRRVVADDAVIVPESLRALAYNDVVNEQGSDPAHLFPLNRWQRFVALWA